MIQIKFIHKKETLQTIECDVAEEVHVLINREQNKYFPVYGNSVKTEVTLTGDLGGVFYCNSDCYPVTVHEISNNGKKITYSNDQWQDNGKGGFDFSNDHSSIHFKTMKLKDGKFKDSSFMGVRTGYRQYYQNPSF